MATKIVFDMDGTIADLYANPNWLKLLRSKNPEPYAMAKPLVNMSRLARYIHKAQVKGVQVSIISWLAKESSPSYDEQVTQAKLNWLQKHLPSVRFDTIDIIPYGTPKAECVRPTDNNILFDDEERNRKDWTGSAFKETDIFEILKDIIEWEC